MKRIVVLCDGTWKDPDDEESGNSAVTNVVKLWTAVAPEDQHHTRQVVIYDAGVGTGTNPSNAGGTILGRIPWLRESLGRLWKRTAAKYDRVLGGAFGIGLSHNIEDTYLRLVQLWEPGDELFLLGFSRGAYTVRSLAGLIRNCGVLAKEHTARFDEAFELYKSDKPQDRPDGSNAQDFVRRFSRPVTSIKFVGVWDTVGSLGIPDVVFEKAHVKDSQRAEITKHYAFHDVTLSRIVENAFHALAIDERRDPFKPTLWQLPDGDPKPERLRQVWFTGVHSDVGGGYPDARHGIGSEPDPLCGTRPVLSYRAPTAPTSTSGAQPGYGLSDVTLHWMASRARECGLALQFGAPRCVVTPEPTAGLNDSYRFPYDRIPAYLRPVLQGIRTNERLHESVQIRRQTLAGYAPPSNLAACFAPGASPMIEPTDPLWMAATAGLS